VEPRAGAPVRSVTDVGRGDFVKVRGEWKRLLEQPVSAGVNEKLPSNWYCETEDGGSYDMYQVDRYAKAQDMEGLYSYGCSHKSVDPDCIGCWKRIAHESQLSGSMIIEALQERAELLPAENTAFTAARALAGRGDSVAPNTAMALVLTIERLAGL
jgi:hypothetical protein